MKNLYLRIRFLKSDKIISIARLLRVIKQLKFKHILMLLKFDFKRAFILMC